MWRCLIGCFEWTSVHFGGEGNPTNGSMGVFPQVEAYNPVLDRWTEEVPMWVSRRGTLAVTIGDGIYIAGGGSAQGDAPTATFDRFEIGGSKHEW